MKKIKNIAIIAHVDHGKTTLVDQLLRQSGTFRDNQHVAERVMDSNAIEKERGITILAKNTAIEYKDYHINILDTPGHADFGGEVERIMKMVDGVLLVVDAFEGCMPQTRFVLKKALEENLVPIVVVNKIDRPAARPEEVVDEVLELFIELGATDDQIEFPVVYASGLNGTSGMEEDNIADNMVAVFETVIKHIPSPVNDANATLQFQVSLLDYNDYVGRIGIGRVVRGKITAGQQVSLMRADGTVVQFRVTKLYGFLGLNRVEIKEAIAGDIIAVVGMSDINVGETVCEIGHEDALPLLHVDEPTLQMTFLVNNSPFAGREGKFVTSRKIRERLLLETETDVSLKVEETDSPDRWVVSGRGELHLAILIENLRREGHELQVSKPQVIIRDIDGVKSEPVEFVQIDVPAEYSGAVIESMGNRRALLQQMSTNKDGQTRLIFHAYSRGLIGYTTDFITLTKGYGIFSHSFMEYQPWINEEIASRRQGSLVSMENGKATPYGLMQLEDRGIMFIEPGTEVYEGMIVGENTRDDDIAVNIIRAKQLTNVRSSGKDQAVSLKKPRILSLEQSLEYLADDEYCEVTPKSIRLRKKILQKNEREKLTKRRKN
ncbi:GTP-binding protein [Erysipelotrichaceae bacterium]|nr:GTP-binding protein [Erysipelotrichaceae bacterium]